MYTCGGSLISTKFVLTAAHCLHSSSYGEVKLVKLGYDDRNQQNDPKLIKRNVTAIFKYPGHDSKTHNEDLGLIEMDEHVTLNERVLPICLPQQQLTSPWAIAIGFGRVGMNQKASDKLLKVSLERFTLEECRTAYKGISTIFENTKICYGHHTDMKDTCRVSVNT